MYLLLFVGVWAYIIKRDAGQSGLAVLWRRRTWPRYGRGEEFGMSPTRWGGGRPKQWWTGEGFVSHGVEETWRRNPEEDVATRHYVLTAAVMTKRVCLSTAVTYFPLVSGHGRFHENTKKSTRGGVTSRALLCLRSTLPPLQLASRTLW